MNESIIRANDALEKSRNPLQSFFFVPLQNMIPLYCILFYSIRRQWITTLITTPLLGRGASRKLYVWEVSQNECFCRSDLVSAVSFVPPGTRTNEFYRRPNNQSTNRSNNTLELDISLENRNLICAIPRIFIIFSLYYNIIIYIYILSKRY
jgi:hypothetical protein